MSSKAKLRLGLIAIAAGIIVYYFYFRTEYYIESYSSETGKYAYIVEEYGEDQHRIRKVDMETDNVLWNTKIKINYRLNHQARRNLSPLFFDKKNVYYYIHDISDYHLAAFDKNTGSMKFAVDLNKNIKEKVYPCLYRPFFNLEDKIVLMNRINSEKETLITVIDKESGNIVENFPSGSSSYSSSPLGLNDKESEYFSLISPGEISVFNKKDIKKNEIIKRTYMFNYHEGNNLYYFGNKGQLIRKDLKTGSIKKLWKLKGYAIDIFRSKDSYLVYSSDKKRKSLQFLNGSDGKLLWSYKLPEDYYFYSTFAKDNQKYDPETSVYSNIDYKYFPVIISFNDNKIRKRKVLILERETGNVVYESKNIICSLSDLLSSRIFKFNNKFIIQYKNQLVIVSQNTGKIIKAFSLKYKDKEEEKTYYLGRLMPKNIIEGYLFLRYGRGIVRIDLSSFKIKKTGVSKTFRIETEDNDIFDRIN